MLSLLSPIVIKDKGMNFSFEGVKDSEFCLISSIDAWTPLSYQTIKQSVQINSLPQHLLEKQLCITNLHLLQRFVRAYQFCSGSQLFSGEKKAVMEH